MSSLSTATSLSSSMHAFIGGHFAGLAASLSLKLGRRDAGRKPRAGRAANLNLERDAGGPHDDADRLLAKRALVGGHDGVEARFIIVVAGQHDLDVLAGLTHDPAAVAIAPLSDRISHGQAVGEARHHF